MNLISQYVCWRQSDFGFEWQSRFCRSNRNCDSVDTFLNGSQSIPYGLGCVLAEDCRMVSGHGPGRNVDNENNTRLCWPCHLNDWNASAPGMEAVPWLCQWQRVEKLKKNGVRTGNVANSDSCGRPSLSIARGGRERLGWNDLINYVPEAQLSFLLRRFLYVWKKTFKQRLNEYKRVSFKQ